MRSMHKPYLAFGAVCVLTRGVIMKAKKESTPTAQGAVNAESAPVKAGRGRRHAPKVIFEEAIPVGDVVEGVEWSEWEDSVLQHDTQFYADELLQALVASSADLVIDIPEQAAHA